MVKVALPELVRVIAWEELFAPTVWLAKVRLERDRLAAGVPAMAMPEKVTFCGLPEALSLMFNTAERVPGAEGLKMIWSEQVAPAARATPQSFV